MKASSTANTGGACAQWTHRRNTHPLSTAPVLGHTVQEDASEGALGCVPGRRRTAALPGHCSGRGPPSPTNHMGSSSPPSGTSNNSVLEWKKMSMTATSPVSKIQGTSGATIYCARYPNGLTRWSNVESPRVIFSLEVSYHQWSSHRYSAFPSAQDCKYLHKLEHPPKSSLCRRVSCAWYILDSLSKTLFLPNPNAINEEEPLSITANRCAMHHEDRIWLLTPQQGFPTAGLQFPVLLRCVTLLPNIQDAVGKVATRTENPSI